MNDQADLEYDAIIQQAHLARAAVISAALRRFGSWIGHFFKGHGTAAPTFGKHA
jgi:hypothetical protein